MRVIFYSFFICFFVSVSAQIPQSIEEYTVSGEYLNEAYRLYFEDKDKSIEQFELIHKYDTNYAVALADMEYIYNEKEQYEKAEALAREALKGNYPKRTSHYLNLVGSLFSQEKFEEAGDVIQAGLLEFPYNNSLLYNRVLLLEKKKLYQECAYELKHQLEYQYYYGKAHLKAGILAHNEDQISKAMMSLGFYLIINSGTDEANGILNYANSLVQSKQDMEPIGFKFAEGDDFSEIDLLINNYVANSKKYKVPFKVTLPIIKQFHLLLSKLEYDAGDKGFFMNYYVPVYNKILKEDRFQGFAYTLLSSSKNESHMALCVKRKSEIDAFKTWFYDELAKSYREQEVLLSGELVKSKIWFDENQRLEMIGEIEDGKTPKGKFNFYYDNGALSTEGEFNDNGEKTGVWKRYHTNSKLKEVNRYEKGKLNGETVTYYDNGNENFRGNFVDDQIEGKVTYHQESGPLTHSLTFEKSVINGPAVYYHAIGTKKTTISYKEGDFEGDYTAFYPDGKIEEKGQFKADKRMGDFIGYHNNGKISGTYSYNEEGKYDGEYKSYYSNGQLSVEGVYTKGYQTGKWKYYYYDGLIQKEITLDESGKLNGSSVLYDIDGKKHSETVYKKGDIQSSIYYNKKGEIIRENEQKGKDLAYKSYTPRGYLESEGNYHNHEKDGVWKFYFSNGELNSVRRFKEGKTQGIQEVYFESGIVNKYYKDVEGETKNSAYMSYFDNGELYEKGFYYNDKRAGEWEEYYRNGEIESKSYFINDDKVGVSQEYTVLGVLDKEYFYDSGVWNKCIQYDSIGNILKTQQLVNGTGKLTYLTQEGKPYAEFNYVGYKAHGTFTWFYPNGSIQTKGEFFNGNREGSWIWNHPNGALEKKGEYKFGEKVGVWLKYSYTGKLMDKTPYVNGEVEGVYYDYDRHGVLSSEVNYRQGEKHGKTIFYNENKEVDHIRYYDQGIVIAYGYLGKDGKEIEPIKIEGQTADVVSYYATGEMSRRYKLVKGLFDGVYEQFYKNGQLISKSAYVKDLREGEAIDYYKNGEINYKLNYAGGVLDGRQFYYFDNGKVEYTIDYIVGESHGWSYYYDNTGKETFKVRFYNDRVDGF